MELLKPNEKSCSLHDLPKNRTKFFKHQNIFTKAIEVLGSNKTLQFTDNEFPPNSESLYGKDKMQTSEVEEEAESFNKDKSWQRACQIYEGKLIISNNNFSAYDIVQGALGDCYYLSALGAIAKFPKVIQNLFIGINISELKKLSNTKEFLDSIDNLKEDLLDKLLIKFNSNDSYENTAKMNEYYINNIDEIKFFVVKLRIHGEWTYILLDEFFPTYTGYPSLIFAKSNSYDLWVPLIEKAWAKILKGYYKTSLGGCSEGLMCLTDAPTISIKHTNLDLPNELWEQVKMSSKNDWLLACFIGLKRAKAKDFSKVGLITNHCYSIIRLAETTIDKKTYKFFLVRNPHGSTRWCGKYHDEDKLWTDKLKKAIKFDEKDDGCFWVELEEYFKLFDWTFLNKFEDNFVYNTFKISKKEITDNNTEFIFLLKIGPEKLTGQRIYFGLHQKYKRIYGKGKKDVMAHIIIAKVKNEDQLKSDKLDKLNVANLNLKFICGGNNNQSISTDAQFDAGYYIIYAKVNIHTTPLGFVLSSYSKKDNIFDIKRLKFSNNKEVCSEILKNLLINFAEEKCKREVYDMDKKSYKVIVFNDNPSGFGIIYVNNKNEQTTINTTVILKDFSNLKMLNSEIVNNEINLKVAPLKSDIVYFSKVKMKCGFKITCRENFSLDKKYISDNIKTIGEKKELELSKSKVGVFLYTKVHAGGYVLLFENTNKKTFNGKLIFTKLDNLSSPDVAKDTIEMNINSGGKKYIYLDAVKQGVAIGMAYKISFLLK